VSRFSPFSRYLKGRPEASSPILFRFQEDHVHTLRQTLMLGLWTAVAGLTGCDSASDEPLSPDSRPAIRPSETSANATATVFATGLRFPRGFTFGADGSLYVAEAGSGGSRTTSPSQCEQVAPPIGPYSAGRTARISRIDRQGHRTTFATGFPSARTALGDVIGVADVAILDGRLYALVAGGGCSRGIASIPAGIARVSGSGDWNIVTNLSAFVQANPVAHPGADFEPDGSWYSMLAVDGKLFVVEANHQQVLRVVPSTRQVRRVVDLSDSRDPAVPTALGQLHGNLYLGNLGHFPVAPRTQKVWQLTRDGDLSVAARGFTAILGVDFDSRGRLYVLETTNGEGFPTPGTGRVVRLNRDGSRQVMVSGLFLPTAMRFGPDGRLYISNKGYGPPQSGEILRVNIPD
jgi:hypothetical protein